MIGNEVVLDIYCGIGIIGLYMVLFVKYVYGVEVVFFVIEDV